MWPGWSCGQMSMVGSKQRQLCPELPACLFVFDVYPLSSLALLIIWATTPYGKGCWNRAGRTVTDTWFRKLRSSGALERRQKLSCDKTEVGFLPSRLDKDLPDKGEYKRWRETKGWQDVSPWDRARAGGGGEPFFTELPGRIVGSERHSALLPNLFQIFLSL